MSQRNQVPTPAPGGGGGGQRVPNKRLTTADFIARAQATHGGGAYDYSVVVYLNRRQKVKIICPEHGPFEQLPLEHCKGKGCPKCGYDKAAQARTHTTASFIAAAQARHGVGTYGYSEVEYKGSNEEVTIICQVHGRFEQTPHAHTLDIQPPAGCQRCALKRAAIKCARVDYNEGRKSTLYFIRLYDETESFYKVGITTREPKIRFQRLKRDTGCDYEVLATYQAVDFAAAYDWEQKIIESFSHLIYKPQKRFQGELECFSSAAEILAVFPH